MENPTLKELAEKHKCDKGADGHHTYTEFYEKHFELLRDEPVTILEIGVGGYKTPTEGGNSLRMWKEWFPHAQIHGVDIEEKTGLDEERIKVWKGSQTDEAFLKNLVASIGNPDIIIDDGSHVSFDVNSCFNILFPLLKDGGVYVIEDTQTSYWKHYGGDGPNSHIEFFKKFIDGLHYKEIATESRGNSRGVAEPTYTDLNILSICFYHNILFITKGNNSKTA